MYQLVNMIDAEGNGTCSHCGRENLRWLAVLTNGTDTITVGSSCAKRELGIATIPTNKLAWMIGSTLVATKGIKTLWTRGNKYFVAKNGNLVESGTGTGLSRI